MFKFIFIKKSILPSPLFFLLFILTSCLISCQKDSNGHGKQQGQPLLNTSTGISSKIEFDENTLLEKAGSCSISEINKKGEFHKPCSAKKIEENSDKERPIF